MEDREPKRRRLRWPIVVLSAALIWLFAAVTPSPYAVERPGPVVNALGEVDTVSGATAVVRISGAETFPATGELNVVSVAIYGSPDKRMSWLEIGGALLDPSRKIVPLSELYPEGTTTEDRNAASAAMMRSSQQRAVAAALIQLGEPVGGRLSIVSVRAGGPSDGKLREGDVVRTVGGSPVETAAELRAALDAALAISPEIEVVVGRGDTEEAVRITPAPIEPGGDPLLGVSIASEYEFPFEVELNLGDIGGPSAGLVFALAVYDLLTPGGLAGDLVVSATGTIDESGSVGAIGGLEQKLWGAARAGTELFLMPLSNCADLPDRIPNDMRVVPVASLQEAIDAIESVVAGEAPPGVERCSTGDIVRGAG